MVPWVQNTHDFPTPCANWSLFQPPPGSLTVPECHSHLTLSTQGTRSDVASLCHRESSAMSPSPEKGVGRRGWAAAGRMRNMRSNAAEVLDIGVGALGLGRGRKRMKLVVQSKGRETAISCLLANKIEGSELWPP